MSGLAWGDVPGWIGSVGTVGALGFAGLQIRQLQRQSANDRLLETSGVAATLVPTVFPDGPDRDGTTSMTYCFTVHNPGRFPIVNVHVGVKFPFEVARVHRSGKSEVASKRLDMTTPVIAGLTSRQWDRRLVLRWSEISRISETVAEVRFEDLHGNRYANLWPRSDATQAPKM